MDRNSLIQVVVTITVFATIKLFIFLRRRHKRYQLFRNYGILGPKPSLFHGNYLLYRRSRSKFLVDKQLQEEYGKTVGYFLGDYPVVISSDLELLRKVFLENFPAFTERMELQIPMPLSDSILFANYARWRYMRKAMSPTFNSYRMRGIDFIERSVGSMLAYIEDNLGRCQEKRPAKIRIDILDLSKSTALHLISNLAVNLRGVEIRENEPNVQHLDAFLNQLASSILDDISVLFPFVKPIIAKIAEFVYNLQLKDVIQGLESRLDENLEKLPSKEDSKNLMNVLARENISKRMSRKEVIANGVAILIAGYDTTSTTLAYVFWALGKHPEVQNKLRSDLRIYGIESEYLEQVLSEVMRRYPTVISFASRFAKKTVQCNGLTIPRGTHVSCNNWLLSTDPDIWQDPMRFDPERFKPELLGSIHPCAYAPFGLGERKCIGYYLARLEVKSVICDILLRYSVGLIAPNELELVSWSQVLSKPKDKILITLERVLA